MEAVWAGAGGGLGVPGTYGDVPLTPTTLRRNYAAWFRSQPPRWRDASPSVRQKYPQSYHRNRVIINVSGMRIETQLDTLNRYPNTLLGDEEKRRKYYDPVKREYFFDRHRPSAEAILAFYQTHGTLTRPFEVPLDVFTDELKFFEIDPESIAQIRAAEGFVKGKVRKIPQTETQRRIWEMTDCSPEEFFKAKVFSYLCIVFTLLSTGALCLETIPSLSTVLTEDQTRFKNAFFVIEAVSATFFAIEVSLRLFGSPDIRKYARSKLGLLDIISAVPVMVNAIVLLHVQDVATVQRVLRYMRLIRSFRVFKLSRYSRGLRIIGEALANSSSDIAMLLVFMAILVVLFAAGMYFVEVNVPGTAYTSIPEGFWWALVTMVTLGYGDMTPTTGLGKFIGSLLALAGILTIALPVPIIVTRFDVIYSTNEDPPEEEAGEDTRDDLEETEDEEPTMPQTMISSDRLIPEIITTDFS
ncbi:KCNA1 [Branchiostoma lanceolatum]|uniref:KCNA1 protein n=1 Tax=Branchiostoma lanceolatum TaxID=7740 RepID=A0A8K0EPA0_BRALA|nr:KCNA1 [Branchiostoma lanceolatum]